jgi:hypothetical protein
VATQKIVPQGYVLECHAVGDRACTGKYSRRFVHAVSQTCGAICYNLGWRCILDLQEFGSIDLCQGESPGANLFEGGAQNNQANRKHHVLLCYDFRLL